MFKRAARMGKRPFEPQCGRTKANPCDDPNRRTLCIWVFTTALQCGCSYLFEELIPRRRRLTALHRRSTVHVCTHMHPYLNSRMFLLRDGISDLHGHVPSTYSTALTVDLVMIYKEFQIFQVFHIECAFDPNISTALKSSRNASCRTIGILQD